MRNQTELRRVLIFRFYQRSAHIEVSRFLGKCSVQERLRFEHLHFVGNRLCRLKSYPNSSPCSLSGLSPFVGADDFETMTNVSLGKFSFDYSSFDDISSEAKDFVEKLLVKESSKRMTAKNALNHEWLNCAKENSEREITLSLTKTKLKRYVILRRLVSILEQLCPHQKYPFHN